MPGRRHFFTFHAKEIARLFKVSKRYFRHLAFDLLIHTKTLEYGRLLVVTPKAIGNAPERNKVRRRLKEIFYVNQLYSRGYDCIIIVKKDGSSLSFEALSQLVLQAFPHAPSN